MSEHNALKGGHFNVLSSEEGLRRVFPQIGGVGRKRMGQNTPKFPTEVTVWMMSMPTDGETATPWVGGELKGDWLCGVHCAERSGLRRDCGLQHVGDH